MRVGFSAFGVEPFGCRIQVVLQDRGFQSNPHGFFATTAITFQPSCAQEESTDAAQ